MRKNLFLVIIIFVVVFCLSGCSVGETFYAFAQGVEDKYDDTIRGIGYYSDTPLYHDSDFNKDLSAVSVALSESNIENIGQFSVMARLVSQTVWGRAPMKITFVIQDVRYGGTRTFSYEDTELRRRLDDNGLWRKLYAARVEMRAVNMLKPLMPQRYNVVGVIVTWEQERIMASTLTHSVCDFDGDGKWDYYSSAPIDYYGGVREPDNPFERRILDDAYETEVVIVSEDDLIEMPPLEKYTFYDIQKAMKSKRVS